MLFRIREVATKERRKVDIYDYKSKAHKKMKFQTRVALLEISIYYLMNYVFFCLQIILNALR